jgi:transposase
MPDQIRDGKSQLPGIMFAFETGGHYWRNIAYFLDGQGIPFQFINQYTLKWSQEGKDLNLKRMTIAKARWHSNSYVPGNLLKV